MALKGIEQPDHIEINDGLRLRKYDGDYAAFLPGYQDPVVYENSEGIFDPNRIPNLDYVKGMCTYLSKVGELYIIEVKNGDSYIPIGDVTVKDDNPPLAIWNSQFRGKGIGKLVLQAVIDRLRQLGYKKIKGSTVYRWNTASRRLHEGLGFVLVDENERERIYDLVL